MYVNDIKIFGHTQSEIFHNAESVLRLLMDAGLYATVHKLVLYAKMVR